MEPFSAAKGRLKRQEKGSASIISLFAVLAAFLIGTTYLYLAQAELRMTTRNIQARQAVYLAEAGVELARAELARDQLWQPLASYDLGPNKFSLNLTRNSPTITVRATGKAGEASRTLEVTLLRNGSSWKVMAYREAYN